MKHEITRNRSAALLFTKNWTTTLSAGII